MLYHPTVVIDLFRQMKFSELSPVAKRLVVADKLNRGHPLMPNGATERRAVARIVGEDGFEVLQDLVLLVQELEAENRRLRRSSGAGGC